MAKEKKNKKINVKKSIHKNSVKITALTIIDLLKDFDVNDIIPSLFILTTDEELKSYVRIYEKQLILAKMDEDKFKSNLYMFLYEESKLIKKEKRYRSFYKFINFIHVSLHKNNVNENIIVAYQNILLEQQSLLVPDNKIILGIDENGELILGNSIIRGLNEVFEMKILEAEGKLVCSLNTIAKTLHKYGHNIKTENDLQYLVNTERHIHNQVIDMGYFINNNNRFLIPDKFFNPNKIIKFPDEAKEFSGLVDVKSRLKCRNYLLPPEGLKIELSNFGDIKYVTLVEEVKDNNFYLLYRIDMKSEECEEELSSIYGFYSVFDEIFYSMWEATSLEGYNHNVLENVLLRIYLDFTCLIQDDEKQKFENSITKCIDKVFKVENNDYYNNLKINNKKTAVFTRDSYKQRYSKVSSFLRKLPVGSIASDNAKELAGNMGIVIPPGMTFVREFTKFVHTK